MVGNADAAANSAAPPADCLMNVRLFNCLFDLSMTSLFFYSLTVGSTLPYLILGRSRVGFIIISLFRSLHHPLNPTEEMFPELFVHVIFFAVAQRCIPRPATIKLVAPHRREDIPKGIQTAFILTFQCGGIAYRHHVQVDVHMLQVLELITFHTYPFPRRVRYRRVFRIEATACTRIRYIVPIKGCSQ